ncbi:MAG: hypothetical protein FIB06_06965 [Betaproteobacteria bacterium]|nr:hypothetical protein [Betaproteobacteria bacterium]
MNPNSIYARTEKGTAEVAQRSQAIPNKARSLLLMIDGKASGAQLLDKFAAFPNSAELLQILEDGGYIAAVAGAPAAAAIPRPAAAAAPVAAAPAGDSLATVRRFMNQTLREIFGPDADELSLKVDKAASEADLRTLAEKHRDLIASVGGRRKAEAYWQTIEVLLPPA